MSDLFLLRGKSIKLKVPSDRVIAKRVAKHLERRLSENDWRPYSSKEVALSAWQKLGGIRADVLRALELI